MPLIAAKESKRPTLQSVISNCLGGQLKTTCKGELRRVVLALGRALTTTPAFTASGITQIMGSWALLIISFAFINLKWYLSNYDTIWSSYDHCYSGSPALTTCSGRCSPPSSWSHSTTGRTSTTWCGQFQMMMMMMRMIMTSATWCGQFQYDRQYGIVIDLTITADKIIDLPFQ